MQIVWVGIAGFFGAAARYWVDGFVSRATTGAFPWGTWVVNVSGCFLVGLLATVLSERLLPHPTVRIAITVGFIGAYTTFSTFAYETVRLGQGGAIGLAVINLMGSLVAGITATGIGILAGRAL